MNCDIDSLVSVSRCFKCIPGSMLLALRTYLICQWQSNVVPVVTTVIVADGIGGYWQLIVDPLGNVGAEAVAGPQTPDVILADGFGGFWQLIINSGGLVGSTSVVLPATTPPILSDGAGGFWTIIVDQVGDIGASLI